MPWLNVVMNRKAAGAWGQIQLLPYLGGPNVQKRKERRVGLVGGWTRFASFSNAESENNNEMNNEGQCSMYA